MPCEEDPWRAVVDLRNDRRFLAGQLHAAQVTRAEAALAIGLDPEDPRLARLMLGRALRQARNEAATGGLAASAGVDVAAVSALLTLLGRGRRLLRLRRGVAGVALLLVMLVLCIDAQEWLSTARPFVPSAADIGAVGTLDANGVGAFGCRAPIVAGTAHFATVYRTGTSYAIARFAPPTCDSKPASADGDTQMLFERTARGRWEADGPATAPIPCPQTGYAGFTELPESAIRAWGLRDASGCPRFSTAPG